MKKVVKLTESDLVRIIEKVINESDLTQKIVNHELSNWISFKLGPKVLSGNFVSKGSWISFNGKQYSKPLNNSRAGSGTWEKSADVIKLNFK
jgi:hypothetical protein